MPSSVMGWSQARRARGQGRDLLLCTAGFCAKDFAFTMSSHLSTGGYDAVLASGHHPLAGDFSPVTFACFPSCHIMDPIETLRERTQAFQAS